MEIVLLKKCYSCKDKHQKENYWQEVYADSANKAKYIHADSYYDDATYITTICRRNKDHDKVLVDGEEMLRFEIESHLEYKKWRSKLDSLKDEKPNAQCLIYSGQWSAWWRSGKNGYTAEKKEAGIYTVSDAYNAVHHCGIEKRISLHLL